METEEAVWGVDVCKNIKVEEDNPVLRLYQIAAQGELIRNFSLHLLSILVRADIKGRMCDTMTDSLELMELCFSLAEDEGILYNPGCFQLCRINILMTNHIHIVS